MYNPRLEKSVFKKEVRDNVKRLFRKEIEEATQQQLYQAVSLAIKEAIIDDWYATQKAVVCLLVLRKYVRKLLEIELKAILLVALRSK